MIIDAVPMDLKYAIVVGIGTHLSPLSGMKNCGIIAADPSTFVALGKAQRSQNIVGLRGFFRNRDPDGPGKSGANDCWHNNHNDCRNAYGRKQPA